MQDIKVYDNQHQINIEHLAERNKQLESLVLELSLENRRLKGIEEDSVIFAEFLWQWLNSRKGNIEANTFDAYKLVLEKHLYPYFKKINKTLKNLKPIDIQEYYTYKINMGLSPNTVLKHHANIHNALEYARKNDLLEYNVSDRVELPKKVKYHASYYTVPELLGLFEIMKGSVIYPAVLLAALLGLRRSEILGLKWENIDFKTEKIVIGNKLVPLITTSEILISKTLKSKSSNRKLPLPQILLEYLKSIKPDDETIEYVCADKNGKFIQPNYLTGKFKEILQSHGAKPIRFHDLRHSCASMLYSLGYSLRDIQEWLGHSNISTTSDIYVHLEYADKKPISQKINQSIN